MLSIPGTHIAYPAIGQTTASDMRFGSIPPPEEKWKSLMLVGIFSIHAASAIVLTNPSDMRFGSAQHQKDMRGKVGCAEAAGGEGVFFETCFSSSLLVRYFRGRDRGTCVEENGPRWSIKVSKKRRKDSLLFYLYSSLCC